jgi:hypothetical protein
MRVRDGVNKSMSEKLAVEHVDWLLKILRPLLITEFEHGYKHGYEDGKKEANNF